MSAILKPCPFCGGDAELPETEQIEHNSWSARINCHRCEASVSMQYTESSPDLAIERVEKLWNSRY